MLFAEWILSKHLKGDVSQMLTLIREKSQSMRQYGLLSLFQIPLVVRYPAILLPNFKVCPSLSSVSHREWKKSFLQQNSGTLATEIGTQVSTV